MRYKCGHLVGRINGTVSGNDLTAWYRVHRDDGNTCISHLLVNLQRGPRLSLSQPGVVSLYVTGLRMNVVFLDMATKTERSVNCRDDVGSD